MRTRTPSAKAKPDNQADSKTCAKYAVAKATVECKLSIYSIEIIIVVLEGLDDLGYEGKQCEISSILTSKSLNPQHPDDLNGEEFFIQLGKKGKEEDPNYHSVAIEVQNCTLEEFKVRS